MRDLVNRLKYSNLTISTCESLTGGLFASKITRISGASKVYLGSLVTYQNEAKMKLLGLTEEEIRKYGVISEYTAEYMANKVRELLNTDIAVSFTGNAGPDVMENKPVGLVYIGINFKGKTKVYECHFKGNRDDIRRQCLGFAKSAIHAHLDGKEMDEAYETFKE